LILLTSTVFKHRFTQLNILGDAKNVLLATVSETMSNISQGKVDTGLTFDGLFRGDFSTNLSREFRAKNFENQSAFCRSNTDRRTVTSFRLAVADSMFFLLQHVFTIHSAGIHSTISM